MKPSDLLALLREVYQDRLGLMADHRASAERVGRYQFNNTYQYIIAREETQLQWIADAIVTLGGTIPEDRATELASDSEAQVIAADLEKERAFVERWRPRVAAMTHARHRKMLDVVLGESLEHVRFFVEAAAGHLDLLGRSDTGAGERGTVLASRWLE